MVGTTVGQHGHADLDCVAAAEVGETFERDGSQRNRQKLTYALAMPNCRDVQVDPSGN